jgi:carboxymethylenebutenolidase
MWVEYPEGNGKTGVVIVMQHGTGLDDWMRSVADQIAHEGYIAVAPDIWSGTGANGGGRDSFQFDDDAMKAAARIAPPETLRRYKAAWEWAMKLPRANGKSGTIGFCAGGGNSFLFAGEVPELSAAVVFYGTPPAEEIMARIKAPVLGFYGENDARVTSTVEPTIAAMKRLGKFFEPHIYPKTTHSFVLFQDIAANQEALKDAWPRAMAFFKQNLK